jgi:undecaprenyl-diphosphatase
VAATGLLAAEGGVSAIERDAFHAVNHLPQTAAPALWVVMQAGSFPAVFVTAGLALVARRPRLAVALAAGGTATWLLAKVVKQVVDRGRPEAVLHDVVVYGPSATGLGYPSGHAAVAALILTVAAPYLTRPAKVIGWVVVGLVAFTRVYIGAHFPLDAAGGLFLGWAIGSAVNLLLGTPEREAGNG